MMHTPNFSALAGVRQGKGLTLVELMISLALSSFLVIGVMTLFVDSRSTERYGSSLARVQEGARIGFDMMASDIRMTGFQGCADPTNVTLNIIANNVEVTDFAQSSLRGFEVADNNWAAGTEFDNTDVEADARIGSDVIAIQRGVPTDISITGNMTAVNANLQVAGNNGRFVQEDAVMISDCENADLFRIRSNADGTWAHSTAVNSSNFLSNAYDTSARIYEFTSEIYFVADTGRNDSNGNDIFSLYRERDSLINNATPDFEREELVEGVESMQILYGEKLSSGNIRFVTANTAGLDMSAVVAVKIGLLVSATERVLNADDAKSYVLPGQTITPAASGGAVTYPNDRRLRRTFVSSINIRNRS